MQVILLQNVPKVGKKFDVVSVSDGYAKNLLFPKKLAEIATQKNVTELVERKKKESAQEEARMKEMQEKLRALTDTTLVYKTKADDAGHLYKKIHAQDIARLIQDASGLTLSKEAIVLEEVIHATGEHTIRVEDTAGKSTFTLSVVAE